jgi:hypothetical protein
MNTKELQRVTREQAARLKKAGFDLCTDHHFYKENLWKNSSKVSNKEYVNLEDNFSAPTVSLALKWMREEKNLFATIRFYPVSDNCIEFIGEVLDYDVDLNYRITYEAAELELLDELLTLLEKEAEK